MGFLFMKKNSLAALLARKREDAKLTRAALATQLGLAEATVVDWECGLSYPSIELLPQLCRVLQISEKELYQINSSMSVRRRTRQALKSPDPWRVYQMLMTLLYGVALVACFICNVAIDHQLTWFYIVLVALMLGYTLTNLPWRLKRGRLIITAAMATLLIYLLLYVCCWYVGGDWLLTFAYPVATVSLAFCWLILLIARYLPVNVYFKMGLIFLLIGVFSLLINPLIEYWSGRSLWWISSYYFSLVHWPAASIGPKATFLACLICFVMCMVGGIKRQRNQRNAS